MSKQRLYLFVGYPGAGKTTVAKMIAEHTGAVHLWADLERHIMFGQPTHSKEESHTLYEHLNGVADELLSQGKSVIYDTNFNFRKDRDYMRQIAARHNAEAVLIWINTPRDVAQHRATEESDGQNNRIWGNMSPEDFSRLSDHLQPPSEDEQPIVIDCSEVHPELIKAQLGL